MDAGDGFEASRDSVMAGIVARGPHEVNPVVSPGTSTSTTPELKQNFDDPASPTTGVEFVGTSTTPGGTTPVVQGGTPAGLARLWLTIIE